MPDSNAAVDTFTTRLYRARWFAYCLAVVLVAIATILRLAFTPVWGPTERPFIFYFAAVIAAAWVGRLGPALVCTILGATAAYWAFFQPVFEFKVVNAVGWSVLAVFLCVSIFVSVVVQALHVARDRAASESERRTAIEERFASAFRSSPDGMSIIRRRDGLLLEVNDRWLQILGVTREQVIGRTSMQLGAFDDPAARSDLTRKLEREGRIRDYEILMRRPDGERRHVSLSIEPIECGDEPALISTLRDVTAQHVIQAELLAARDEAVRANRAKDDFLAVLSHELRTPLNPILLLASEGASDPQCPPEYREDFATIARNASLEARLISDLLDLGSLQRGRLPIFARAIDAHAILREVAQAAEVECAAKGITLLVKLDADSHSVNGDADRLQQVFRNLLNNSTKFTPAGGTICIESRNSDCGANIQLSVRDSGAGMTRQEIERAFRPFQQGDHAEAGSTSRFGGLGLGLAIAESIVTQFGGKIHLTSEGLSKGTTATVTLPVLRAPAQSEHQPFAGTRN